MDDIVKTEKLIAQKNGPVGEIIFNNPAKRNAVSLDMWQRLHDVLAEFEEDPDIRVLVLSGAGGKAFVSGADISKFESERATKEAVEAYGAVSKAASSRLYNFPRPTIAKIHGFCVGGGVGIAVCCDMRFCGERSRFAIPAAKLGVGYGFAGVKRLADIVGTSRTMEIFYTARQFTAAEAYEMGLVNRVLPESMLDRYVEDYTDMIA
ncbi:MAG: enoyl-CoA hydratase-related protein, partial [Methyloligellaceae bacterium]